MFLNKRTSFCATRSAFDGLHGSLPLMRRHKAGGGGAGDDDLGGGGGEADELTTKQAGQVNDLINRALVGAMPRLAKKLVSSDAFVAFQDGILEKVAEAVADEPGLDDDDDEGGRGTPGKRGKATGAETAELARLRKEKRDMEERLAKLEKRDKEAEQIQKAQRVRKTLREAAEEIGFEDAEGVVELFEHRATIDEADDVVVGSGDDALDASAALKKFAETERGKRFMPAKEGGGSAARAGERTTDASNVLERRRKITPEQIAAGLKLIQ